MTREQRREMLMALLKMIEEAEAPRKEYKSPLDRSDYNYGYMTANEAGAGETYKE